jgi:Flp pilus assembly protein TadD
LSHRRFSSAITRLAALAGLLLLPGTFMNAAAASGKAEHSSGKLIPATGSAEVLPEPDGAAMPASMPETGGAPPVDTSHEAGTPVVATPTPSGAPIVAVLDFESNTLPAEQVQALSAAFWSRLSAQGGMRLLPREETRAWLIRNDLYPYMPYQQPVPLPRVVQALKADQLVTGRIDQVQGAWNFELAMQKGQETLPRQVARVQKGDLKDVMFLLDRAAAQARSEALGLAWRPLDAPPDSTVAAPKNTTRLKTATSAKQKTGKTATIIEGHARRPAREKQLAMAEPVEARSAKSAHGKNGKVVRAQPVEETIPAPAKQPEPQAAAEPKTTVEPLEPTAPNAGLAGVEVAQPAEHAAEKAAPSHPEPAKAEPKPSPSPTPAVALSHGSAETGAAGGESDARALYKQAMEMEGGNPQRLAKLEQAATLAPADSEIQMRLAHDYYSAEKFEAAVTACDRALRSRPNDSMLYTIKGSALFELRRFAEARDAHTAALKADPANNWARYNLALALTQLKAPEATAAWRDYLKSARQDPAQATLLAKAQEQLATLEPATTPAAAATQNPASKH